MTPTTISNGFNLKRPMHMTHLKKCLSLFAGILLLSSSAIAEKIILDRVVAIVDDDVVMASELQSRLLTITRSLQASNTEVPPLDVMKSQVLERLIVEQLQLQMAKRANVQISDEELNQAIGRIQQGNKLTKEQFLEQLAKDGMTIEALRHDIRRELVLNRVQQGSVNRRINISKQEVDGFLASQEGKFWASPDYLLGHILIATSSDKAVQIAAEEKANKLQKQLLDGADFRNTAVGNSSGQNALNGGDMGWRKIAQLPSLFADIVPSLAAGDVSAPFESPAGFHILKLYEQRGGGEQLIDQAKVRHILVKPSEILSNDEAHAKLLGIRQSIIDGADFAEQAKEHSEDIGSMLSGGDLGWSLPGQFVPEFESMMGQIEINDVSVPFRSQFGWHILQVQERRSEDMSENMRRNQASNLLRKRRFDEELQIWLQEIRDEAFVEITLK